jgi:hypothetical protein
MLWDLLGRRKDRISVPEVSWIELRWDQEEIAAIVRVRGEEREGCING